MHAEHGSSRTLSVEWSSQSSFHLPQLNTEDIGETREEEHNAGFKETYGDESTQAQGNIVKSGFLGRCDDPYCTTCPYEDWSETAPQTKGDRGNLVGKLKDKWVKGSRPFRSFPVFSPHTKLIQRWNQLFAISSLVAVFIDPLFFFIFSVEEDEVCISFNANLAMVITILRSITDTLYFLHMLLQFRLAYIVPASKTTRTGILETNPKRIALHYLKGWFLIDFAAVIPLPQILLWFVVKRNTKTGKALYLKDVLRAIVLLQYLPRVIRLLPVVLRGSQSGFIFETAWTNFLMNFFLYILAAHVVGSCWYLFGLQRVNECLHQTCDNETQCQPSFLDCGRGGKSSEGKASWIKNTSATTDCFSSDSDSSFDYGIYKVSLPVTSDTNFAVKYVYSLFWGFLQISTLGGNLTPSIFAGEVVFTISVISLGLLLFALLIGNMQNFLQYLTRRQMEMQFKSYDVEAWMKRRSMSPDLQRQVRQAVRFKWLSTRGVDEEQLIENLPEDLQLEIRRFLCFRLVKKVPIFTVMDEQVLDAICERLQKRLYIKGSEILQAYGPINRMLFIVRGKLLSVGKDGSRIGLSSGDFCGEELLNWCLGQYANQPGARRSRSVMKSAGHRAISSRTVRAETSVEAFSLEENDLLYVTKHYSRHMRNPRVQGTIRYHSPYFRSWAANSIQAAWKYRQRKKGQKSMAQRQEYYQE